MVETQRRVLVKKPPHFGDEALSINLYGNDGKEGPIAGDASPRAPTPPVIRHSGLRYLVGLRYLE